MGVSRVKIKGKVFLLEMDLPPAPLHRFASQKESPSPAVPVPPPLPHREGKEGQKQSHQPKGFLVFSCFLLIPPKNNSTLHTGRQWPLLSEAPLQTTCGCLKGWFAMCPSAMAPGPSPEMPRN